MKANMYDVIERYKLIGWWEKLFLDFFSHVRCRCPFCELPSDSPDLLIDLDRDTFACAACDASGGPSEFVRRMEDDPLEVEKVMRDLVKRARGLRSDGELPFSNVNW